MRFITGGLLRSILRSLQSRPHFDLRPPFRFVAPFALLLALLVTLVGAEPASAQGAIFVTSLEDKVNGIGGCSLQEAIYSSRFHASVAINGYVGPNLTFPNIVPTQCLPGTGNDTIVLPSQATFILASPVKDADNPFGPTATPMVTSNITIQANGSTLQWTGGQRARAFTVASTGNLTLLDVYIRDFHAKGGDGTSGGGGGLGAGGAVYLKGDGGLTVERSTFSGNDASGGNGASGSGGGGGGIGGNGGHGLVEVSSGLGGGGGGGAVGSGGDGGTFGGGGGGTLLDGHFVHTVVGIPDVSLGGFQCGGDGGNAEEDGSKATCAGGGGGGGGKGIDLLAGVGGNGGYGGGGGGGGSGSFGDTADGGKGGFGGGGGAGWQDDSGGCGNASSGGDGGFGGGGGAGPGGQVSGGPGHGGTFGGDAACVNGGGGAALGGAIFSDGGHLVIHNSTFALNSVDRGLGGISNNQTPGDPGSERGGAIFAVHGTVDIRNSTFSTNTGITLPEDVLMYQTDAFILYNSIFDSFVGLPSCVATGSDNFTGAGNLISGTAGGCPGVVGSASAQVAALALNPPGLTPTMAISKASSAFDAADANTSLTIDQRGFPRPQQNGFDIGAFELCIPQGILGLNCSIPPEINPNPPSIVNLTIQVSLPGTGTTIPAPGNYPEALNSVVVVAAIPNSGYGFVNWTGGVADPTNPSTTVIIDGGKTITANFAPLKATMFGNVVAKSGASNARVWNLSLLDNGPGATNGVMIHDFTLTQTFGAACAPVLKNTASFPLQLGNLGPSQTGTSTVTLDFTGCATSARFTAKFTYSANSGVVEGFVIRTNQYQ